ncbi:hypothetical protein HY946_00100 [Candidatus Gottesmanbacteria bacterium]|nr:hypothetical protein [Candidatus Gottesmanbacteria bacterium]
MAKRKLKFPHISRIFNATLLKGAKLYTIAFAAALLFVYIFQDLPVLKPFFPTGFLDFERMKLAVMLAPNNISSHLLLSQEYLKRGDMEAVERELLLAQNLVEPSSPNSPTVLGASLSPLKILEKIKNEPQKIRQEISFWEKVAMEKQDYRDAYIRLAILNYQIYETERAKEYLKKALELDPNFEPAREIKKMLGD